MGSDRVTFAPLRREDLSLVSEWLAEPVVHRWWDDDPAPQAVERHFGPAIDGLEPTEVFLAFCDDAPFGLVQRYRIDSYPEYEQELCRVVQLESGDMSFDYLIGVPERRGLGLGAHMLAALAEATFATFVDAPAICVAVHAENAASWRALQSAGFVRIAEGELTPDNAHDSRDHYFYQLRRPA
jgi:aminoglycoside 6'-N-acetyltransferase